MSFEFLSDKYKTITRETFENLCSVGMRKDQIMTVFQKSHKEMDEFCKKTYGNPSFDTVFNLIRQQSVGEYLSCMKELGVRGNPSAISITKELLLEMNEKQNEVVSVRFVNNIDGTSKGEKNEGSGENS